MTEDYLAQIALEKFTQRSGMLARWEELLPNQFDAFDGYLAIEWQGRVVHFSTEIKSKVDRQVLGLLLSQKERLKIEYFVLIAPTITDPLKMMLREHKIGYIDGAGNAYLQADGLFIQIEGNKNEKLLKPKTGGFTAKGLVIIFHLLENPDLVLLPYKTIAQKTGVSSDTISETFAQLKEKRFLVKIDEQQLKIIETEKLKARWIETYPDILKPKQHLGNFSFLQTQTEQHAWENINLQNGTVWGSEPAAALLTHYLQPQIFTLYTTETTAALMRQYRLVPNPKGNIEVYKKFWNDDVDSSPNTAPKLLVYADLINSQDGRNINTAKLLNI
jgi:hypothetical protein